MKYFDFKGWSTCCTVSPSSYFYGTNTAYIEKHSPSQNGICQKVTTTWPNSIKSDWLMRWAIVMSWPSFHCFQIETDAVTEQFTLKWHCLCCINWRDSHNMINHDNDYNKKVRFVYVLHARFGEEFWSCWSENMMIVLAIQQYFSHILKSLTRASDPWISRGQIEMNKFYFNLRYSKQHR